MGELDYFLQVFAAVATSLAALEGSRFLRYRWVARKNGGATLPNPETAHTFRALDRIEGQIKDLHTWHAPEGGKLRWWLDERFYDEQEKQTACLEDMKTELAALVLEMRLTREARERLERD